MRALVQRVKSASVRVAGVECARIARGLVVLLGIHRLDSDSDVEPLARKVLSARIFEDEGGRMSRSVGEAQGEVLVVSQITLYGAFKKGQKPDFSDSMGPVSAEVLYGKFLERMSGEIRVSSGKFGARMEVELVNDGPVTFMMDTRKEALCGG